MTQTADVVVVGGGIAGSAVSFALARQGLGVIDLESQATYRDRVRGEVLVPWGVAEARALGLEQVLLGAGGCYSTHAIGYDETLTPEEAECRAFALDSLIPGVPGFLNVGHPQACEALSRAAAQSGTEVIRDVSNVRVLPGRAPEVRYESDGQEHTASCRLVIGADGRRSTVRDQAGIRFEESVARTRGGGLLVDELSDWPAHQCGAGTEGDLYYLVIPRPEGRVRLYLLWDAGDKNRFRGPQGIAEFLGAFGSLNCLPMRAQVAASKPAGPCVSYPMNDSWCDRLSVDGVVLIGDAAGWNDPIIGQGLAISLRDARTVSQILGSSPDWSPDAFRPYEEERSERMRRLRITAEIVTELHGVFDPEAARRRKSWAERALQDESLFTPYIAHLRGPETLPADVYEPPHIRRILSGN